MINFKKTYHLFLIGISLLLLFSCASAPQEKKPFWIETADALMTKGIYRYNNQQFFLAKKEFLKALNAYQRFNDVQGMAQCRLNLTKTHISLGENADQHIDILYKLINENDLSQLLVYADIMQASININNSLYDEAENILNKYIHKTDLQKDVFTAILINRLRVAFAKNVDVEQWLQEYESSIDKNNKAYNARLLRFKAQYAHMSGNKEKSDQLFKQALIEYRALANSKGVFLTLKEWGDSLIERKDWDSAYVRYNNALITAQSMDHKNDIVHSQKAILKIEQHR